MHVLFCLCGLVAVSLPTAAAATANYIACYLDDVTDRDVNGKEITYATMVLDKCLQECRKDGYPYAGLQQGTRCFCGNSYGKHGVSPYCNLTCSGENCGGYRTNDVYYVPKTDAGTKAARQLVVEAEAKTHAEGRRACVRNDGDLAMITSASDLNSTLVLLKQAGLTSGKAWIGIRKSPQDSDPYKWLDYTASTSDLSAYNSYWNPADARSSPCVVVSIPYGKWESVACGAHHPTVCKQVPASVEETVTEASDAAGDEAADGAYDATQLSLYIVLPLFAFCYGGSCLLYCGHKIWKSLKKKKRQNMSLTRLEELPGGEYEPDNKPKPKPPMRRPLSAGKRMAVHPQPGGLPPVQKNAFVAPAPAPMPPPPPPFKEPERAIRTPVENIKLNSEENTEKEKKVVEKKLNKPSPPRTPPDTSRPQTTRDVEICLSESPRGSASAGAYYEESKMKKKQAKTKEEAQKAKLLENALKEARDRRKKERSDLESRMADTPAPRGPGADTPDPVSAPLSAKHVRPRKKPEALEPAPSGGEPWATRKNKKRNPKYGDDGSGDSTINLLSDNDGSSPPGLNRNGTELSIQEILQMKVAANQSKQKRPKKILSA